MCLPTTVPWFLHWLENKKRFLSLVLIVFISLSLFASQHLSREPCKLAIFFLDLEVSPEAVDKSGDATVLISPEGKVMLLDSGHPESFHLVIEALKTLNVQAIDIFVASHPHIDHIGGFPQVAATCPIKQVYRSNLDYRTNVNQAALQAILSCLVIASRLMFTTLPRISPIHRTTRIIPPSSSTTNRSR